MDPLLPPVASRRTGLFGRGTGYSQPVSPQESAECQHLAGFWAVKMTAIPSGIETISQPRFEMSLLAKTTLATLDEHSIISVAGQVPP